MPWVVGGVAVALVLLLVVFAFGKKEEEAPPAAKGAKKPAPAPADAPAKDAAKATSKKGASGARAATKGASGARAATAAGDADEEEPEGTKVASIPPPGSQKGKIIDLAADGESSSVQVEVAEEADEEDDDDPTGPVALILVTAIGRTDAGRRRKHNEDSYLVLPEHNLFVIADGMGGYAAGEVASQLAVDVIAEAYKTKTFTGDPDRSRPRRGDELVRAIQMANTAILTQAQSNEAQSGMGTTLVSCRFSPNKQRCYIAHVGDSRLYRIRNGVIKQLTQDHTLGAAGITGPAAAKLSRAVGIQETVEVDLEIDAPRPGDHYILCSDGLSKMVPDEMIRDLIVKETDLEKANQLLIETANDRGGRDNISVILVRVQDAKIGRATTDAPAAATP